MLQGFTRNIKKMTMVSTITVLTACTPIEVITGTSATLGSLALSDAGFDISLSDTEMNIEISKRLSGKNIQNFANIDVEVHEARVMLVGNVMNEEQRLQASQIAWSVPAVQEVLNEIQVEKPLSIKQRAADSISTLKIMTAVTFNKDIHAVNYKFSVVNDHAYVMGVALSKPEEQSVINQISTTEGITGYTSEILLADDERRYENLRALIKYLKKKNGTPNSQGNIKQKSIQTVQKTKQTKTIETTPQPTIKKIIIANPQ